MNPVHIEGDLHSVKMIQIVGRLHSLENKDLGDFDLSIKPGGRIMTVSVRKQRSTTGQMVGWLVKGTRVSIMR